MKIGFIGLGIMGSRMVPHLIDSGHSVWGYDLDPAAVARAVQAGVVGCGSVREASQGRDAVILSLPSPAIVEQVVLGPEGILSAIPVPALLVDTSSSLSSVTKRLAMAGKEKGCLVLDASVSGGPEGAEAATLSIMVGASPEVFERALRVVKPLGKDIFRIGDTGAGNAMKLVNNLLIGCEMAAISEALMLGTLAGIDPGTLFQVVSVSSGNSRVFQSRAARVLKGNFEPGFTVDLMHKDLDLAAQLGKELGMPMPMTNVARELFQMARASGLGRKDHCAIALALERLMGVEIREK